MAGDRDYSGAAFFVVVVIIALIGLYILNLFVPGIFNDVVGALVGIILAIFGGAAIYVVIKISFRNRE